MKYSKEQIVTASITLAKQMDEDGRHLKNPPKYSSKQVSERCYDKFSDGFTGELNISDEIFQTVLHCVTKYLSDKNRISNNSQGEGYNIWMKDLKWFLSPKNERGFGSRCVTRCKELQNLMGWTDEQMNEVARCFDKIILKNGNHEYRGVDSNNVYRDNTSNLGKITVGLGDKKKDVTRGNLGKVDKK